jgi:HEAT repeat protein
MKRRQKATEEKHVSAKTRSEVLADIQRLEASDETRELRAYLIQLAKWSENPQQYENLLRSYLYSPEPDLREAAVFSLLFALQIQKQEYRSCALKQLTESEKEDFDARQWAAASLATAYQETKDAQLLHTFFAILDDESEDDILRSSIARDTLLVWGLSSGEQGFRVGHSTSSLKAMLHEFDGELTAARKFMRAKKDI